MTHWFKALLLLLLPHHLLSRIVQWTTRCRHLPLRKFITRWFVSRYKVDMSEAVESDPTAYPDFNSFFTRALHSEVRPVVQETGQICCPADGTISQLGDIFVGSIETVWAGEVTPPRGKAIKVTTYDVTGDNVIQLQRGEEMGRFNMGGSTIIVLFGPDCVNWKTELSPEMRVQFGQPLGRVLRPPAR